jgi:hypothetical protein
MRCSWCVNSKMPKNTSIGKCGLEDMAIWVGRCSGTILGQQWLKSGSRYYGGLNMHNFLNTCLVGANEVSIGIYVKYKWGWNGCLLDSKTTCGSYAGVKLLGASNPSGWGKIFIWPQILVKRQKIYWRWRRGFAKSPRDLYGWGGVPHPPEAKGQGLHGHWPNVKA